MKRIMLFLLITIGVFCFVGCSETQEKTEQWDYPPMVMFRDQLYTAASFLEEKGELTLVGKIESSIDFGRPTENNQANDDLVGCEIYTASNAEGYIFVLYRHTYSTYKAVDMDEQITEAKSAAE